MNLSGRDTEKNGTITGGKGSKEEGVVSQVTYCQEVKKDGHLATWRPLGPSFSTS